uniref:Peptidase S1 domain-containing protein n=1 Tax=Romanomermis culicivorax TaxID=13658 RepID=A0A915IMI7_ROMCU
MKALKLDKRLLVIGSGLFLLSSQFFIFLFLLLPQTFLLGVSTRLIVVGTRPSRALNKYDFIFGVHDTRVSTQQVVVRKADQAYLYPEEGLNPKDIALLYFHKPIKFTNYINGLCLTDSEELVDLSELNCFTRGWRATFNEFICAEQAKGDSGGPIFCRQPTTGAQMFLSGLVHGDSSLPSNRYSAAARMTYLPA